MIIIIATKYYDCESLDKIII